MLSLVVALAVLAPAPAVPLSLDAPAGTDLLGRVEMGKVWGVAHEMLAELDPLLGLVPGGRPVVDKLRERVAANVGMLQKETGVDFTKSGASLTFAVDFDAAGGAVWGAVVRGAQSGKPAARHDDAVEPLQVDDAPAWRLKSGDLAWHLRPDGTLILGSERGLIRTLRNTLKPAPDPKSELTILAQRIRTPGPLALVVAPPKAMRQTAAKSMATVGPLVRELKAASLAVVTSGVELKLVAETDKGKDALENGSRSLVALLRASTALVEAGAQAVLGLDRLGKRPEIVPRDLDADDLKKLSAKWVEGFTLTATVHKRPPREVEVVMQPSSPRGLMAAVLLGAAYLLPRQQSGPEQEARLLLMALRQLELTYHEKNGSFFVCGPVPEAVPKGAVDFPNDSCFATLGFKPPGKVHFQLLVSADDGELMLQARGDPDGDGMPETWALDETSPLIRRMEEDSEGPQPDEPKD